MIVAITVLRSMNITEMVSPFPNHSGRGVPNSGRDFESHSGYLVSFSEGFT